MTRTLALPHFSASLVRSQAEMVDGCGGTTTVGTEVGVAVGTGVAVGAGVFVVAGGVVVALTVVPAVVVGFAFAVVVWLAAVVAPAAVTDSAGAVVDADAEALTEGPAVREVSEITVPGVAPAPGLLAAAFVEPSSLSLVTNTASNRNASTASTPPPKSKTRREMLGSPGDGGRSARTPLERPEYARSRMTTGWCSGASRRSLPGTYP